MTLMQNLMRGKRATYNRSVAIGRVERSPILPPERYWLDVFGEENIKAFDTWKDIHTAANFIKVLATEHFPRELPIPAGVLPHILEGRPGKPPRNWILFEVLMPVPFENRRFGFPEIAGKDIESSADTVQRPPPEPGAFDKGGTFDKLIDEGKMPLIIGGAIVVGGLILVASLKS